MSIRQHGHTIKGLASFTLPPPPTLPQSTLYPHFSFTLVMPLVFLQNSDHVTSDTLNENQKSTRRIILWARKQPGTQRTAVANSVTCSVNISSQGSGLDHSLALLYSQYRRSQITGQAKVDLLGH